MTPELHSICRTTAARLSGDPDAQKSLREVLEALCEAAFQTGRLHGVTEAQAVVETNFAIARAKVCA